MPYLWGVEDTLFDGIVRVDEYALLFKVVFLLVGITVILSSVDFVRRHLTHPGEYYAIILVSVLAMMLLAASGELLTAYNRWSCSASPSTSWRASHAATPSPTRRG